MTHTENNMLSFISAQEFWMTYWELGGSDLGCGSLIKHNFIQEYIALYKHNMNQDHLNNFFTQGFSTK